MAKRKVFGLSDDLTAAMDESLELAENYSGQLHFEQIPLEQIELDPENPRELSLTLTDAKIGVNDSDPDSKRKQKELESLESLVNSIKAEGLLQPILTYKTNGKYRVIAGERRTLASTIAGQERILARIFASKPDAVKLGVMKWVENIERKDLSLFERLSNVEQVIKYYLKASNNSKITATHLSELLFCSIVQASRYLNIINSKSEELKNLIRSNKLSNIKIADLIAKSSTVNQAKLIKAFLEGKSLHVLTVLSKEKNEQKRETVVRKRGAQKKSVSFGSTKSFAVAKELICLIDEKYNLSIKQNGKQDIDWNDYATVTKLFQDVLKELETKLA